MTEDFKQYIEALAAKCKDETWHGEYRLSFTYADGHHKDDNENSSSFVTIHIDTSYLWARMTVYPALFSQYERGEFESCGRDILHELCHLYIEPVAHLFMWDAPLSQKDYFTEVIERQTQRICNTVFRLLPEEWYSPESLGLV